MKENVPAPSPPPRKEHSGRGRITESEILLSGFYKGLLLCRRGRRLGNALDKNTILRFCFKCFYMYCFLLRVPAAPPAKAGSESLVCKNGFITPKKPFGAENKTVFKNLKPLVEVFEMGGERERAVIFAALQNQSCKPKNRLPACRVLQKVPPPLAAFSPFCAFLRIFHKMLRVFRFFRRA